MSIRSLSLAPSGTKNIRWIAGCLSRSCIKARNARSLRLVSCTITSPAAQKTSRGGLVLRRFRSWTRPRANLARARLVPKQAIGFHSQESAHGAAAPAEPPRVRLPGSVARSLDDRLRGIAAAKGVGFGSEIHPRGPQVDPKSATERSLSGALPFKVLTSLIKLGAGEGIRTLDPNLGKVD